MGLGNGMTTNQKAGSSNLSGRAIYFHWLRPTPPSCECVSQKWSYHLVLSITLDNRTATRCVLHRVPLCANVQSTNSRFRPLRAPTGSGAPDGHPRVESPQDTRFPPHRAFVPEGHLLSRAIFRDEAGDAP